MQAVNQELDSWNTPTAGAPYRLDNNDDIAGNSSSTAGQPYRLASTRVD